MIIIIIIIMVTRLPSFIVQQIRGFIQTRYELCTRSADCFSQVYKGTHLTSRTCNEVHRDILYSPQQRVTPVSNHEATRITDVSEKWSNTHGEPVQHVCSQVTRGLAQLRNGRVKN